MLEVKNEIRNEKDLKRRPPIVLYRPPQMRQHKDPQQLDSSPSPCRQFKLEVEVEPESWWRGVVQHGQESALVEDIQKQYNLTPQLRDALLDMILEFARTSY